MKMLALLRGINVGGNRKVPMAELRSIAKDIGFTEVETYINSGNLIFDSGKMNSTRVATLLEKSIKSHFGFHVDVVVRTKMEWKKYASGGPFPDAANIRPNLLMIALAKQNFPRNSAKLLAERASKNEQIKISKGVIWVDFGNGVGKSKLTPAWLDKTVGSPVTLRNWRTVLKLSEILSGN